MLPNVLSTVPKTIKYISYPTQTYQMHFTDQKIQGMTDQLDAVKQAIFCILATERYEYLIYSWNYGVELKDLYGQSLPFVKSEVKRRITEALLQDDRMQAVDSFTFTEQQRALLVSFRVYTEFGEIKLEKEVSY